jgi:transposase
LVAESGFDGGYQTVKRYVRKLRGKQPVQPRAVIRTEPGEESQVDYGTGAMVRDPQTRKYRRTRLFVMVLGCSRKAARFLTFRSSLRIWADLHEKAFRRLGGATRVVVLDNSPPCLPKKNQACCRFPWNRFATTNMASGA